MACYAYHAMSVFTPNHRSLDQILETGATYVIPSYQRPYSWEALGKSDQNNQVNRMWDDLWEFFCHSPADKEYFLGSMVIIARGQRTFDVIDGQQRLTTVVLLFAAMRCFLREFLAQSPEDPMRRFLEGATNRIDQILYNSVGISLVQELKVKIQHETGFNFDAVLNSAIRCEAAPSASDSRYQSVIARYFRNRDYFIARLRQHFTSNGAFTTEEANRFISFFTFLNTRVSIVMISTTDFDTAYSIFEILNNRGLPLSGLDLLRNLIIRELDAVDHGDPAAAWLRLEQEFGITEDFMGRWVESRKASQQRSSAFNDMVELYRSDAFSPPPGQPRIHQFYDALTSDLKFYGYIVDPVGNISCPRIRSKVRLLPAFGNERYSNNLMMALFRHYSYEGGSNPEILAFLTTYQRWLMHVLISPGVHFSNAPVYRAIRAIREGDLAEANRNFALTDEQRASIITYLDGRVLDNYLARLLLAAFVLHHQALRDDVVTQELNIERSTVEHIIPQQPAANTNWLRDFTPEFREAWTYRLGNMTLLTHKMNASARNFDFAKKRERYLLTLLPITQEVAVRDVITPEFIVARHQAIVAGLLVDLGWAPTVGGAAAT